MHIGKTKIRKGVNALIISGFLIPLLSEPIMCESKNQKIMMRQALRIKEERTITSRRDSPEKILNAVLNAKYIDVKTAMNLVDGINTFRAAKEKMKRVVNDLYEIEKTKGQITYKNPNEKENKQETEPYITITHYPTENGIIIYFLKSLTLDNEIYDIGTYIIFDRYGFGIEKNTNENKEPEEIKENEKEKKNEKDEEKSKGKYIKS